MIYGETKISHDTTPNFKLKAFHGPSGNDSLVEKHFYDKITLGAEPLGDIRGQCPRKFLLCPEKIISNIK